MSIDADAQWFGDPSEPGAPGHRKWKAAQKEQFIPCESELVVDARADQVAAIRAEARSAYLGGVMDKHHPDL